jgi:formylglycine-generating enzyme required for sulfatase activity
MIMISFENFYRNCHFTASRLERRVIPAQILFFLLIASLAFSYCPVLAAGPMPPSFKNKLGMTLRLVPGGIYLMGSPSEEVGRYWQEGPQHKVQLAPFYITDKEITNAQYGQFLDATGQAPPLYWLDKNLNAPQQPVVGVTWHDAVAFANWLSTATGEKYRLPTEAEWESACRGGLTGQPFPWGNQPPEQGQRFLANYNPNPYDKDGFLFSAPVGSFPSNGYGLFDMSGNVAEWCGDWYDADYYSRSPYENPQGPASGTYRVIRGGSWYARARELRCAARQFFRPSRTDGFIGFRLVHPAAP